MKAKFQNPFKSKTPKTNSQVNEGKLQHDAYLTPEQARELKQENEKLRFFVSAATHDLKAPLRILSCSSAFLSRTSLASLSEKHRSILHEMENSAKSLYGIVENMNMLSRVERAELDLEEVDLNKVINEVRRTLALEISLKGVKFEVVGKIPPVLGNQSMLYQVCLNLISNSLRYACHHSSPEIVVDYTIVEKDKIQLSVVDNGPGVSESELTKIFHPFTRGTNACLHEGTGLGLFISETIVSKMGGKIWASQLPTPGLSINILLPLLEIPSEKRENTNHHGILAQYHGTKN